jgi:hypothetical protein
VEAQQPLQPTSGTGVVARIRLRPNELVIRRSRLSGNALGRMESGMITVKYDDLSSAFDFVSFGAPFEHRAFVSRDTGTVYWISETNPIEDEELPDDLDASDRYIAVPHKNELDLGNHLALRFAEEQLPHRFATIEASSGIEERTRVSRSSSHRKVVSTNGMPTRPRPQTRRSGVGARRMRFNLTRRTI